MSDLQVTNVFADGDTVSATNFNTNYSDIVTYINNRNSGSSTWDAFYMTSASNIPTFNNSTGTQDIAQMKDNGTIVFECFDGGIISTPYQEYSYSTPNAAFLISSTTRLSFTPSSQTHSNVNSSGKFTCASNGKYYVTAQFTALADCTSVELMIYKNGASVSSHVWKASTSGFGTSHGFNVSDIISLVVGDYIEIYVTPTGGNLSVSSSNGGFFVSKIS